jgi:cyclic beta-1,2-glucan synthetase
MRSSARELAESARLRSRAPQLPPLLKHIARVESYLKQAFRRLDADPQRNSEHAAAYEWLVENRHIVQRAARQLPHDMPRGFLAHLPALEPDGQTRIGAVARAFLHETTYVIEPALLREFCSSYQERVVLRIG